ncbi:MAG: IS66 family insertion sequence element accessory protein TnpB [Spirochaetia bacterium]|nr:IS66 family insertion sequence element accessory protein TnpB [Spirochaetia bacterium]
MVLPFDTTLEGKKIFLRVGSTDFRRGTRGMISLVLGAMDLAFDDQSIFVFCSTSRKQIRIVYCEGAGCWMCTRVIRYGRFPWPKDSRAAALITAKDLRLLLSDPVSLEQLQARRQVTRIALHL